MFDMLIVEDDDFKLRSLKEFILSYAKDIEIDICLLYTSPSPRDQRGSRMPSSA